MVTLFPRRLKATRCVNHYETPYFPVVIWGHKGQDHMVMDVGDFKWNRLKVILYEYQIPALFLTQIRSYRQGLSLKTDILTNRQTHNPKTICS